MSSRAKLCRIRKSERSKYENMSFEQCSQLIGNELQVYSLPECSVLYEIGKTTAYYNDSFKPFFDFDVKKETECEFLIMDREDLVIMIKAMEQDIADYYKEIYDKLNQINANNKSDTLVIDEDLSGMIASLLHSKSSEWNNQYHSLINTDKDYEGCLVRSVNVDYCIFNLVHILRTFDFENDYLIYSYW